MTSLMFSLFTAGFLLLRFSQGSNDCACFVLTDYVIECLL